MWYKEVQDEHVQSARALFLSSCDLVDVPPALEQCPTNAMHAGVGSMVRVVDVVDHLLRSPPIARRKGLVPRRDNVLIRIGASVLMKRSRTSA